MECSLLSAYSKAAGGWRYEQWVSVGRMVANFVAIAAVQAAKYLGYEKGL
jgi:hypothetical protein